MKGLLKCRLVKAAIFYFIFYLSTKTKAVRLADGTHYILAQLDLSISTAQYLEMFSTLCSQVGPRSSQLNPRMLTLSPRVPGIWVKGLTLTHSTTMRPIGITKGFRFGLHN